MGETGRGADGWLTDGEAEGCNTLRPFRMG